MKKIMYYIKTLIFGKKAVGEQLSSPTFKTIKPDNIPSLDQWVKHVNFGSRYGHKGSYYERR